MNVYVLYSEDGHVAGVYGDQDKALAAMAEINDPDYPMYRVSQKEVQYP